VGNPATRLPPRLDVLAPNSVRLPACFPVPSRRRNPPAAVRESPRWLARPVLFSRH